MKITNEMNYNIFREYDIRGIYNEDLTEDTIYTLGKAFGSYINGSEVVIGYDNRESSPEVFNLLSKGINDTGSNVTNLGLVTTPMYYYALTKYKYTNGIMITASHNPKEYNGFKITFNGNYNACGDEIRSFRDFIKNQNFKDGNGMIKKLNIEEDYINYLISNINITNKKVVIDCGNGTASIIAKKVFDNFDLNISYIYSESDSTFPNHHPDPSVNENMEDLQKEVLKQNADIGIAFDGDADRIGIIDELGNVIEADLLMIIFIRDMINNLDDKRFIYDVKSSKTIEDEIIKLGGTPIQNRTGSSYQRKKMYEEKLKFAGEFSGHIFFGDKFHGFDDAIYVALRILEILSKTNKTITELLEGVNKYYSTDEEKIKVTDESKFEIIEKVEEYAIEKNYKYLSLDGCKVVFDDGFALVRASNTSPNLTTRYEAKTEKRLNEIKEEFDSIIKKLTM